MKLHKLQESESFREFYTGSLKQINHLKQIGNPNREIIEARWDVYKITVSFPNQRKKKNPRGCKLINNCIYQNRQTSL